MDVQKKLDEIVAAVGSARSMPMSASCVVNRAELLAMLEEVRAALPDSLAQAQAVLGDREQVVGEARREADRIVASAHAERGSLVSGTQVARQSQEQADRILADARRDSEEVRAEADDYVDSKLANFEVVLTKTIAAVDRGREKLLGRGPGTDERGVPDQDVPERSADPEELRRRADHYVDTKLASFEAVLGKTLEAVGRGRQKLLGRRPADELGEYQDGGGEGPNTAQSDADYVAALAGPAAPPTASGGRAQQPGYDGYGYGGGYQDGAHPAAASAGPADPAAAGYPQEGYAAPAGYPAQDYDQGYGWQQPPYAPEGGPAAYAQDGRQAAPGEYGQGGTAYSGDGYPAQEPQEPQQPQAGYGGGSLDETSFFDTGMIDVERLRELDGGR